MKKSKLKNHRVVIEFEFDAISQKDAHDQAVMWMKDKTSVSWYDLKRYAVHTLSKQSILEEGYFPD
jgi:hypothetical protein